MTERFCKIERERRGSMGDIVKFMKRKREGEGNEEGEGKIENVFRSSKKTVRSPGEKGGDGGMKELLKEMRRDEMREGLLGVRKEIREVMERQKEWMKKEERVERMKGELKEREEKWEREKGEMVERLKEMERELEEMRIGGGEREEVKGGKGDREEIGEREGREGLMERIRRLERKSEWREREERRKNIIIKGVEGENGEIEGKIIQILGSVEAGVMVHKVRELKTGRQARGWMGMITMGNVEDKGKILRSKGKLRGREIWIEEDLTWQERKMRQVLRKEGGKAKMGQGGLWIEGVWWKWDEEREELRDGRGRK
ncbi:hypothetical protein ALC57_14625 [Trachymyrmex cornetzi]|uniref:Uncharacterized protein n=1 Tax=Trachymyrmex cornetzi TaxID=471704 RepID=A0A151IY08_9HYME|nr:hypothetical protein ALC57_14625 [Trachymyrmex cornetzi]